MEQKLKLLEKSIWKSKSDIKKFDFMIIIDGMAPWIIMLWIVNGGSPLSIICYQPITILKIDKVYNNMSLAQVTNADYR